MTVYRFRKAQRVVEFVEKLLAVLRDSEGKPLTLPKYQRRITHHLYGVLNRRGVRQYKRALITVPRKSSKSTYCACLALAHALNVTDNEPNPQVFIAATTLKQAGVIFDIIAQIIEAIPALNKAFVVYNTTARKEAYLMKDGKRIASIRALTKGGKQAEGLNPSLVIADELGKWSEAERMLWDSITSGSGARLQPLIVMISTSADQNSGIFFEQYSHARRVQEGQSNDDELLVFIREADPARWQDESEWIRCNPLVEEGLLPVDNLRSAYKKALVSDAEVGAFKRKFLNLWVGSSFAFLDMDRWNATATAIDDTKLASLPCVASMDLSRRFDFSSVVLLFWEPIANGQTRYYVRPFFWLPEEGLFERQRQDGQPYAKWVEQELLQVSPGASIDYHLILDKLKELSTIYKITEIAYDPYNAEHLVQDLEAAGFTVSPFRQGILSMSPPMKELQVLVSDKRFVHGNNPILTWQAGMLIAAEDEAANVKPSRKNRKNKIDGLVASVMCLGVAMRHQNHLPKKSALQQFMAA